MPILYEMKFEIDEPQFTQREMLGVIDLPATTINTWIKRELLDAFEFERDFRDEDEVGQGLVSGKEPDPRMLRTFKVFQHDPAVRRARMYSILDSLCLAGIKSVLDARIENRYAYQFPELLCHSWTNVQLLNLGRHSLSEEPIILYVDDDQLMSLSPPTPMRDLTKGVSDSKAKQSLEANHRVLIGDSPHRIETFNLVRAMQDAQLDSVTVINWPSVEKRVIDDLKRIINVRGHRSWE